MMGERAQGSSSDHDRNRVGKEELEDGRSEGVKRKRRRPTGIVRLTNDCKRKTSIAFRRRRTDKTTYYFNID